MAKKYPGYEFFTFFCFLIAIFLFICILLSFQKLIIDIDRQIILHGVPFLKFYPFNIQVNIKDIIHIKNSSIFYFEKNKLKRIKLDNLNHPTAIRKYLLDNFDFSKLKDMSDEDYNSFTAYEKYSLKNEQKIT
jgi:hypothetical protein